MKVNGIPLKARPVERAGSLVLYCEAPLTECAALDGQTLTVTHYGETVAVYPDHTVTGVKAMDGYCEVTARRVLAPDTAATLERLEQRQQSLASAQQGQEATNEEVTTRLDGTDEALAELAGIIAGGE